MGMRSSASAIRFVGENERTYSAQLVLRGRLSKRASFWMSFFMRRTMGKMVGLKRVLGALAITHAGSFPMPVF